MSKAGDGPGPVTGSPESARSSQRLCSKAAASTVVNGEWSFWLTQWKGERNQ